MSRSHQLRRGQLNLWLAESCSCEARWRSLSRCLRVTVHLLIARRGNEIVRVLLDDLARLRRLGVNCDPLSRMRSFRPFLKESRDHWCRRQASVWDCGSDAENLPGAFGAEDSKATFGHQLSLLSGLAEGPKVNALLPGDVSFLRRLGLFMEQGIDITD